jgi:G:T-mismatch repair DNA endonuclease (very short patch repair protein)
LEKAGYDLLEVLGLTYQPQYVYGGRYVADAYVEDQNLILQFDGDYWHGHPDKFPYLSERQSRQKEVDERANDAARNLGYRVLRIWESDIRDIEGIKQRILGG